MHTLRDKIVHAFKLLTFYAITLYDLGIAIIKTLLDMCKLENVESMICGFEVIFPALLERARNLGIEIPSDTPFVKEICAARDLKLERCSNRSKISGNSC